MLIGRLHPSHPTPEAVAQSQSAKEGGNRAESFIQSSCHTPGARPWKAAATMGALKGRLAGVQNRDFRATVSVTVDSVQRPEPAPAPRPGARPTRTPEMLGGATEPSAAEDNMSLLV